MDIQNNLINALHHGFIEKQDNIEETVKTKFLTNDKNKNITVLESIKSELYRCTTFTFSVAFITQSGLNELKTLLLDLNEKGIKGRIITSNYLEFNSPDIYRSLFKLKNVEVRITEKEGYHSKGYLFEHDNYETLILGSSNLTSSALKINHEWNLKISSTVDGEIIKGVKETIDTTWEQAKPLTEQWIRSYELRYVKPEVNNSYSIKEDFEVIEPNKMQLAALTGIQSVRDNGKDKAMLVSATGTGKTYLSAFDVKKVQPKRFLFIVHREQILIDARDSFQRVLGNPMNEYGILSGTRKDYDAKYLFSTIQSLSLDSNLEKFNPDTFEYIVIDEVHKSGAPSYKKVMDYFTPEFMLGMTATPERTDGINIYELFDYNTAYEIRLQEAIEEDMISPFHYFGVTDFIKDGEVIDNSTLLKDLVTDERVDHLIDKLEYYGHSGERVRGLIFTSRVEEANLISEILNTKGFRTVSLSGEDSIVIREARIADLENGLLDYLITVDIFNEGIDIPSINQVIMMRETQSSIIFIQQLGRGLRHHPSKEFVTIIDYIGNYKNNYLIPIALSGEISLNKEKLRRNVLDTSYISGISSVNFERVAQERIFNSISEEKLDSAKNLKDAYTTLRNKLGRVPMLQDFYNFNSVDPNIISNYKKNYYDFVLQYDNDFKNRKGRFLNSEAKKILRLYGQEFLNGKRLHEVELTDYLLSNDSISFSALEKLYKEKEIYFDGHTIQSVVRMLDMTFYTKGSRNTYQKFPIIEVTENEIKFTEEMKEVLKSGEFVEFFKDLIEATRLVSSEFEMNNSLTIGKLYTRRDASLLLNWSKDRYGVINGYMFNAELNNCPVFVTYNKVNVAASIDYKNRFINRDTLTYYSKSGKHLNSPDVQSFITAKETGMQLHLFVQKDNATHVHEFYYLGTMLPLEGKFQETSMADGKGVVEFEMRLNTPVEESLYEYITTTN